MLGFRFNNVPGLQACNFITKILQLIPLKSAKFLRAPVLKNIWKQLLQAVLKVLLSLKSFGSGMKVVNVGPG